MSDEHDEAPGWDAIDAALERLYPKDFEDAEWSGWGYELTMRVRRGEGDVPPMRALQTLQKLANWAHASSRVLSPGDAFDTGRPIVADEPCSLTGFGFRADPELPAIDTPHGKVEFVEVVWLHPSEVEPWPFDVAFSGDLNVLDRDPR